MSKRAFAIIQDRDAKPVPFVCMHPSCENKPVRTHSVSKSWLKQISDEHDCVVTSRDKHETFFASDVSTSNARRELSKFDKYATKKLSTCYCFCSSHDSSVFKKIDNVQDFNINRKTAFLLAYRSISHEMCVKRRLIANMAKISKIEMPEFNANLWAWQKSHQEFALECLGHIHKNMQNAILRDNYRDTRFYAVVTDSVPDILCSGFYAPVDEEKLARQFHRSSYRNATSVNDQLALTIMPYQNDKGIVVLSWYRKSRRNKEHIEQLNKMKKSQLVNFLFTSVFHYMDNFFIRPSFWDSLSPDKQDSLHKHFESDVNLDMTDSYRSVRSDTTKYVNWSVEKIRQNVL